MCEEGLCELEREDYKKMLSEWGERKVTADLCRAVYCAELYIVHPSPSAPRICLVVCGSLTPCVVDPNPPLSPLFCSCIHCTCMYSILYRV